MTEEGVVVLPASPTRALGVVCALAMALALLPTTSTEGSVEDARAERERIQSRLDDAARELAAREARMARIEEEHDALEGHVAAQEAELAEIGERIAERIRQVYKHGTTVEPIAVLLASDDPDAALDRAGTVQRLVHGDRAEADTAQAARTQLQADLDRLEQLGTALDDEVERHRERARELRGDLEQARDLEQRLQREERERARQRAEEQRQREEAAQRQRAQQAAARVADEADEDDPDDQAEAQPTSEPQPAASDSGSGMVCPVDQPRSFTDTWGAARSGGRQHRGTDILAPMGTPIRAITSGVWDIQSPGPSAGLWAILRGDDGNQYWYMHLQSHTVADGARVSAGQQTGTNGDTGNARGTPHLHFELHPGGGAAVNPYSMLRDAC